MEYIKDIIELVNKYKLKDIVYDNDEYTKLIQKVYEEYHKESNNELPYFLVKDIISRMVNINITFNKDNDKMDINFRDWDKLLKIDEINNLDIKIPKKSQKN